MTRNAYKISTAITFSVLCISIANCIGWIFHIQLLVQWLPTTTPMHFSTALCFITLSLLTFDNVVNVRDPLKIKTYILAAAYLFLGFICTANSLQYMTGNDLDINQLFSRSAFIPDHNAHFGGMAPNTITGVAALSLVSMFNRFFVRNENRNKTISSSFLVTFLALVSLSLSLSALTGYCLDIEGLYGWGDFTRMSIPTACSMALLAGVSIAHTIGKISRSSDRKGAFATLGSLVIGSVVSLAIWAQANIEEHKVLQASIEFESKNQLALLQYRINSTIDLLKAIERFFASSTDVTAEEFKSFTAPFLQSKELLAIDWAPLVTSNQREQFEELLRGNKPAAVPTIKSLTSNNTLTTAAESEFYFPVLFSEPSFSDGIAIGFDHYSDPKRTRAIKQAITLNSPSATESLTIFRIKNTEVSQADTLIIIPVEKNGAGIQGSRDPFKDTLGIIVGVVHLPSFIKNSFSSPTTVGMNISITEKTKHATTNTRPNLIYSANDEGKTSFSKHRLSFERDLNIAGRVWELRFSPTEDFLKKHQSVVPILLLISCFSITLFVTFYVILLWRRNYYVEDLVRVRTDEIRTLNQTLEERVIERTQQLTAMASIFSEALSGVARVSSDGNLLQINRAYAAIFNATPETMKGKSWSVRVIDEDQPKAERAFADMVTLGRGETEVRVRTAKEKLKYIQLVMLSNDFATLESEQFYIFAQDITTGREREQDLIANERHFRQLSETLAVGIYKTDATGKCLYVNPAWSEMTGISIETVLSEGWAKTLYEDDREAVLNAWNTAVAEGKPFEMQFRFKKSDLDIRWIQSRAYPIHDSSGEVTGYVGSNVDVTAERLIEEKLRLAAVAKSQFLANMSHEIRTPLTAVIGFAEALESSPLSEKDSENVQSIIRNGEHLLSLINDILDFSKIEANSMQIEQVEFSPVSIIEDTRKMFDHRLQNKEIALTCQYQWPLPKTVVNDPLRFKQVIVNLVSNAIKFTEKGSVTLTLSADRTAEELYVSVQDTGIGIPQEALPLLFKPFSQADAAVTRKYGGTGLGLSISGRLIERLGGKVSVTSIPKQGSKFSFSIKTGALNAIEDINHIPSTSEGKKSSVAAITVQSPGKVLIVDDTFDNRKIIKIFLAQSALEVIFAENGLQALEMVNSHSFDLIMMDIQMPVMDGYTAVKKMRERGLKVPIIALTAHSGDAEYQTAIASGYDDRLCKPFHRKAFIEYIEKILSSQAHLGHN